MSNRSTASGLLIHMVMQLSCSCRTSELPVHMVLQWSCSWGFSDLLVHMVIQWPCSCETSDLPVHMFMRWSYSFNTTDLQVHMVMQWSFNCDHASVGPVIFRCTWSSTDHASELPKYRAGPHGPTIWGLVTGLPGRFREYFASKLCHFASF